MGRRRTTGCTARHLPGEHCTACARLRKRRSRARKQASGRTGGDLGTPAPTDPERGDAAADEHRRIGALARAFVHSYLRRGAIVPPTHCERCGSPGAAGRAHSERGRPTSERPLSAFRPRTLHAWHPNPGPEPERLREIA
jgi:hypothetical protein